MKPASIVILSRLQCIGGRLSHVCVPHRRLPNPECSAYFSTTTFAEITFSSKVIKLGRFTRIDALTLDNILDSFWSAIISLELR